jgi:putative hemolysin
MMQVLPILALVILAALSLFFSTLTFAFRDFSRNRLHQWLQRHGSEQWFEGTAERADEFSFITGVLRLLFNTIIFVCVLSLIHDSPLNRWVQYLYAFLITLTIAAFFSLAIPLAIARHAGEAVIGVCARFLYVLHIVMTPAVQVMAAIDHLVGRAAGGQSESEEQEEIEEQILTAVEEGEKEGVVDEQEREMIESVIEFRDATAGEVMTARTDVVALDKTASLEEIKQTFERTGLSRIPVYEETLDKIVGVLYARDMLQYVGQSNVAFDVAQVVRPPLFVPETKPLRDLLRDFRESKIHMAIVLDEYGGTAGLLTIEDVLEQLVGEISDEHEPHEQPMLKRLDERSFEVDARMPLVELNATLNLSLPEDGEIRTIGGLVATAIGRIPENGTTLRLLNVVFTVLDAIPQRINRLRLELGGEAAAR